MSKRSKLFWDYWRVYQRKVNEVCDPRWSVRSSRNQNTPSADDMTHEYDIAWINMTDQCRMTVDHQVISFSLCVVLSCVMLPHRRTNINLTRANSSVWFLSKNLTAIRWPFVGNIPIPSSIQSCTGCWNYDCPESVTSHSRVDLWLYNPLIWHGGDFIRWTYHTARTQHWTLLSSLSCLSSFQSWVTGCRLPAPHPKYHRHSWSDVNVKFQIIICTILMF